MDEIMVGQIVEIVEVSKEQRHLQHKVGRVVMITDGERCVVAFSDGSGATLDVKQLKLAR